MVMIDDLRHLVGGNIRGEGCSLISAEMISDLEELGGFLGHIAGQAFGYAEPIPADRMKKQLSSLHSITIYAEEGQVLGYQSQKGFTSKSGNGLYYSITVTPFTQSRGVGSKLMEYTLNTVKPDVISAKTQNPAAVLSLKKSLIRIGTNTIIHPFHGEGSNLKAQEVLQSLLTELEIPASEVNMDTFVQANAYRGKRLGNYRIDRNHEDIRKIDDLMLEAGLDREKGDAIYYFAFLQS